tara:strand:- start:210 stop:398 length:189 start_codon:yes stop_codon:yes gene_type:complete
VPHAGARGGRFHVDVTDNAGKVSPWWNSSQGRRDDVLANLSLTVIARGVSVAQHQRDATRLP